MAKKKQTIILTHGSLAPTAATTGFTQGEVLVQHAENSVDTSLYTLNEQNEWVRIPSKDYIDGQDEVLSGNISALEKQIEDLNKDKADKSTNISVALTGDVTGSGSVSLTGGTISIQAAVADNSHTHISSNITDSISDLTKCTTTSAELVQGKVVKAVDVKVDALSETVGTINDSYVNEIVVTNTASNQITATKENHKYTFNFDNMVIDGGTY